MATNLSEHLTLEEFTQSDTATRLGIDNSLPDSMLETAKYTAVNLFEPIRALLGTPIHVNSGFRSKELNIAVRGVANSQHMLAEALDLHPLGITIEAAFDRIKNSDLVFDQLILEHTSTGSIWIHASITATGTNRHKVIPNLLKTDD